MHNELERLLHLHKVAVALLRRRNKRLQAKAEERDVVGPVLQIRKRHRNFHSAASGGDSTWEGPAKIKLNCLLKTHPP